VRIRPDDLSTDFATTASVVTHVVRDLAAKEDYKPVGVVLLQPNCPLRPWAIVRSAIDAFMEHPVDSVVSVTRSREKQGHIAGGLFRPAYAPGTRSQDMPDAYFENGVVYVSRGDMVRERGEIFGERIYPLVTDLLYALGDIDTELDFQIAEHLFRTHREHFLLPARHEPSTRIPCAHSS
jgi:CMP-N,N'-diacetyllegionaminic acid synthase